MSTDATKIHTNFNVSKNPFAYIRSFDEVDLFIANIQDSAKRHLPDDPITDHMLRLLWLITSFIWIHCNVDDRNIKSMLKILNNACSSNEITTFEILCNDSDILRDKFNFFKSCIGSTNSIEFIRTVQRCGFFLNALPADEFIDGLKNEDFPTEALFHSDQKIYEVLFFPCKGDKNRVVFSHLDEDSFPAIPVISYYLPANYFSTDGLSEIFKSNNLELPENSFPTFSSYLRINAASIFEELKYSRTYPVEFYGRSFCTKYSKTAESIAALFKSEP